MPAVAGLCHRQTCFNSGPALADVAGMNLADAMERAQVLDFELQKQLVPLMRDMVPLPGERSGAGLQQEGRGQAATQSPCRTSCVDAPMPPEASLLLRKAACCCLLCTCPQPCVAAHLMPHNSALPALQASTTPPSSPPTRLSAPTT